MQRDCVSVSFRRCGVDGTDAGTWIFRKVSVQDACRNAA
jgi:hypothetical protein